MRHLHVISEKTFKCKMSTWAEESERRGPTAPPSGHTAHNTLLELGLPFSDHFSLGRVKHRYLVRFKFYSPPK